MAHKATTWAWETKLPGTRKLVLLALADMADEHNSCYPGQERLAEMTSLAVSTIRRSLGELERDGLIVRARRARQDGTRTSDRYRLMVGAQPVNLTSGQSDAPNRSNTTRSTGQPDCAYEPSSKEPPEEPSDKRIYPEAFEEAWSHWPRKNDKARALQQWQAIKKKHPGLDIRSAVIAYGDAYTAAETPQRWVPYLKTWLNGAQWNDPLPEPRTNPNQQRRLTNAEQAALDYQQRYGGTDESAGRLQALGTGFGNR